MISKTTRTKINELIKSLPILLEDGRTKKIAAYTLCVVFAVMAIIVIIPNKPKVHDEPIEEVPFEEAIEERLENLLAEIDGVGDCRVLVTLESGEYKILAKDSYEDKSGNKYEYVILKGESGVQEGLCVNTVAPEIKGVAVVCEGGDSAVTKSEIVTTVCSVLGLDSTQISVSKMK